LIQGLLLACRLFGRHVGSAEFVYGGEIPLMGSRNCEWAA
jgi:hypothetical protein